MNFIDSISTFKLLCTPKQRPLGTHWLLKFEVLHVFLIGQRSKDESLIEVKSIFELYKFMISIFKFIVFYITDLYVFNRFFFKTNITFRPKVGPN